MRLLLLLMIAFVQVPLVYAVNTSGVAQQGTIRALHLTFRGESLKVAFNIVDKAAAVGFNTVVLLITDNMDFETAPWQVKEKAWSKQEVKSLVVYAKSKGLRVIPEVKLLTHQHLFMQTYHPSMMYNKATYDPRNLEVYKNIHPFIDEIISVFSPLEIHIGHDEVAGHNGTFRNRWLDNGESMLPSNLFLKDVLAIHAYLQNKGVGVWMWGDMLVSPDEFPLMLNRHLHGGGKGYGKAMRNKLPKDIVICDWHYFDNQKEFLSLKVMQEEGFRVIGSTWKKERTIKNFSAYAAEHGVYGMMATTWFSLKKKRKEVDRIIEFSGQTFLKDFPDAK